MATLDWPDQINQAAARVYNRGSIDWWIHRSIRRRQRVEWRVCVLPARNRFLPDRPAARAAEFARSESGRKMIDCMPARVLFSSCLSTLKSPRPAVLLRPPDGASPIGIIGKAIIPGAQVNPKSDEHFEERAASFKESPHNHSRRP